VRARALVYFRQRCVCAAPADAPLLLSVPVVILVHFGGSLTCVMALYA
jgi:hypothetical protein